MSAIGNSNGVGVCLSVRGRRTKSARNPAQNMHSIPQEADDHLSLFFFAVFFFFFFFFLWLRYFCAEKLLVLNFCCVSEKLTKWAHRIIFVESQQTPNPSLAVQVKAKTKVCVCVVLCVVLCVVCVLFASSVGKSKLSSPTKTTTAFPHSLTHSHPHTLTLSRPNPHTHTVDFLVDSPAPFANTILFN